MESLIVPPSDDLDKMLETHLIIQVQLTDLPPDTVIMGLPVLVILTSWLRPRR